MVTRQNQVPHILSSTFMPSYSSSSLHFSKIQRFAKHLIGAFWLEKNSPKYFNKPIPFIYCCHVLVSGICLCSNYSHWDWAISNWIFKLIWIYSPQNVSLEALVLTGYLYAVGHMMKDMPNNVGGVSGTIKDQDHELRSQRILGIIWYYPLSFTLQKQNITGWESEMTIKSHSD